MRERTAGDRRHKPTFRETLKFLAPAAAGGLTAWVARGHGSFLALCAGAGVAAITAVAAASRLAARIGALRDWAGRVRLGERVSAPLASWEPDGLDLLSRDLAGLAAELRAELARLESERDRLEAILGAMAEGVIVIDRHGAVLRGNHRALEIFGLPQSGSFAGRRLWDVSRDPDFNAVVREALARARPTHREVALRGPVERLVNVTAGPTADGSAWVLVLHDVTETKRLERVRTDFVANVSHELRTPLTAIKGFAETLAASGFEDRERAAQFVTIIERQAERLSRLIDDLLTLSDLELGETPLRLRPVALGAAVREVVELLAESARRRGVAVTVAVTGELAVRCDADRLAQVVSNLLDNAIKYTPPGGRVAIDARRLEDGMVEVALSDTGTGIPAEHLPRVAERFYRVDRARVRELGGTGLGLAIVKHIVNLHGGRLAIESRVGAGTTVRVSLPAADETVAPPRGTARVAP